MDDDVIHTGTTQDGQRHTVGVRNSICEAQRTSVGSGVCVCAISGSCLKIISSQSLSCDLK